MTYTLASKAKAMTAIKTLLAVMVVEKSIVASRCQKPKFRLTNGDIEKCTNQLNMKNFITFNVQL